MMNMQHYDDGTEKCQVITNKGFYHSIMISLDPTMGLYNVKTNGGAKKEHHEL